MEPEAGRITALIGEAGLDVLRELGSRPGACAAPSVDELDPDRSAREVSADPGFLSLLDAFGIGHRADDPIGQLSRGTRQRVANALALASGADLLLFDDPFAGLDLPGRRSFGEAVRAVSATVVLVVHDPDLAAGLADVVVDLG